MVKNAFADVLTIAQTAGIIEIMGVSLYFSKMGPKHFGRC
jgi:hypothetical protein